MERTPASTLTESPPARPEHPSLRVQSRSWPVATREILLIVLVYGAYWLVRNLLGDDEQLAARNAVRLFDLERTLGLDWEQGAQSLLGNHRLMQVLNAFYGITHFAVTVSLLLWAFLCRELAVYVRWRTVLLCATALALVGYATFPLMPPRLLPGTGIIDSLAVHGAPWDYHSGPISQLSNQYAAMPSVHVTWALWCSIVVWSLARGHRLAVRVARALAVGYSAVAVVAVVATGNHWVLDVVGGAVVLLLGVVITEVWHRRRSRTSSAPASPAHQNA